MCSRMCTCLHASDRRGLSWYCYLMSVSLILTQMGVTGTHFHLNSKINWSDVGEQKSKVTVCSTITSGQQIHPLKLIRKAYLILSYNIIYCSIHACEQQIDWLTLQLVGNQIHIIYLYYFPSNHLSNGVKYLVRGGTQTQHSSKLA